MTLTADEQAYAGGVLRGEGHVVIHYEDFVVSADRATYNRKTGDVIAQGHVHLDGGPDDAHIEADHGSMNLQAQTGHFYDVGGTLGLRLSRETPSPSDASDAFVFKGREVFQDGPRRYRVLGGWVTSCQLPRPDWMWSAGKFALNEKNASATSGIFRLWNVPVLYLPYVSLPAHSESRQSGFLVPVVWSSSTKGLTITDEYYWAVNRSADLMLALDYFSLRGWQERATFRYKGRGDDVATAHFSGFQDRGYVTGGVPLNQTGQNAVFSGRHDLSPQTRIAANVDYLSSFPYQEAFSNDFSQAASTDILSYAYGQHATDGYLAGFYSDRYQGLKRAASTASDGTAISQEEVTIFHAPSLDLSTTDHSLMGKRVTWQFDGSAAGLKRSEPGFTSNGIMERVDIHPEISLPSAVGGWRFRPSLAVRDTFYSRSRETPATPDAPVTESMSSLNRGDVEIGLDIRPPVIERTFDSSAIEHWFGGPIKHTIEPELTYRYVTGINNFLNVLRFDDIDVASDTNELEYGVTQRLFLRPVRSRPCTAEETKADGRPRKNAGKESVKIPCGNREWLSWRVAQKRFFDPAFGGAIQDGRRNIFTTTLEFSGIAFLTQPREVSPLISRMRVRLSDKMDFEWNTDLDTGAKKVTSNNFLANVHEGDFFAGLSYARLNAPGRSYSDGIPTSVSNSRQIRLLAGYGTPTKPGFGIAANANLDLNLGTIQYEAIQSAYNWDCCGLSVEYGRYNLGVVRDENVWRYSITLKNIVTAGNLNRAVSLF
jgi:LPS-assembly protein